MPIRTLFLSLLLLPLLASCAPEKTIIPTVLSFKRYQPIYMDVSSLEVIPEYKSPLKAPNVEHLIPYSPEDAVRIWVKDRLKPVGSEKILQIIIKNASVIEKPLKTTGGLSGAFTVDPDAEYTATLEVEMRVYNQGSMSESNVAVSAFRTISISENASASTRDEAFRRMIFNLMEAFNAEAEKNFYQYFNKYISFSYSP